MAVLVVVTVGAQVSRPLLKRRKPGLDGRPAAGSPDKEPLVISQRGHHSLKHRYHVDISQADIFAKEKGAPCDFQLRLNHVQDCLGASLGHRLVPVTACPPKPVGKQATLQAHELLCSLHLLATAARNEGLVVWELLLQQHHDAERLSDWGPAIQLHHRQQSCGHLGHELWRLWAVAPHVDLFDNVGDLLLLKHQPDLVAVWAPGGMVPVQLHSDRGVWLTEIALQSFGVGGPQVGVCPKVYSQSLLLRLGHTLQRFPAWCSS
mmetsp:Transcript_19691/g.54973  ORF Transcript_19691/g.54973 Transcript_19691/m.54973 type:complete len:263 (+) Transcript_19691:1103-1891(+)